MDKWRYHAGIQALAELARSGELGPVLGLKTRSLAWGSKHTDVDCIWTLLPHELAIGLEILGQLLDPAWATVEKGFDGSVLGMTAGENR